MIRQINAVLLISGLAFSHFSLASIWSWIDSITVNSSNNYDYNFTIGDWDENDSVANPCYGLSACTIFISHRHSNAGTSGTGVIRSWGGQVYPFLLTARTMGDLGKEIKATFPLPFSGINNHIGAVVNEECVGFFYAAGRDLGSYENGANTNSFSGYPLMPSSLCGVAPAPSGHCDFDQDTLTLMHGMLSRNELEGHEVTEQVNISCTTAETLKLFIYSADKVELRDDGSLYSELYLNNSILGTNGFTIDVEDQAAVNVKSVLRTNGAVAAGEFSGSTVMLITVE